MKIIRLFPLFLALGIFQINAQSGYHLINTFHIQSGGGWDYLAADPNSNKLYVSHSTQVNILDKNTGDSIGVIPNTTGVHGIAFVQSLRKGFISNGKIKSATVFDLKTGEVTSQVETGENPDAILYDNFSKNIYTCNGKSRDLTVIDVASNKVVATIPVNGKPETAVTDGNGKLFVNLEDSSMIVVVDTKSYKVIDRWPLSPGEAPTGLAIDVANHRLFSACSDSKTLVVMNTDNGKIMASLPIGDGCDGDVFDADRKMIFTSNGEGSITAIQQLSKDAYKVLETIPSKRGARTISLDEKTHRLYVPTADFEPVTEATKSQRPKMIPGTFQVLVFEK